MFTKRDLLSSAVGMVLSPLLLIGLAYAVGGKAILAPLNLAVDEMLQSMRQNASPSRDLPATSPPTSSKGGVGDAAMVQAELPQAVSDGNEGMEMTVRGNRLSLYSCPAVDCQTIEVLSAGSRVTLLGKRLADGETEWSHVQFGSRQGWMTRHELE